MSYQKWGGLNFILLNQLYTTTSYKWYDLNAVVRYVPTQDYWLVTTENISSIIFTTYNNTTLADIVE